MMDEFYYLIKFGQFSYSDLYIMPTYERKYFLEKLIKEYEKKGE
jgi:hypothetical protein